jgi:hypothetical protein
MKKELGDYISVPALLFIVIGTAIFGSSIFGSIVGILIALPLIIVGVFIIYCLVISFVGIFTCKWEDETANTSDATNKVKTWAERENNSWPVNDKSYLD